MFQSYLSSSKILTLAKRSMAEGEAEEDEEEVEEEGAGEGVAEGVLGAARLDVEVTAGR